MDRIANQFAKAKEENRAAFVSYVCAGDPDFDTSVEVIRTLAEEGSDVLELGVAFSDPLADGLTNQLAAQRALESKMTTDRLLELIRKVREFTQLPIVLYAYYNMIYARGVENFVKEFKEAGADGILALDLPPEYAERLQGVSEKHGMKNIFIIAPTTPIERMEVIAKSASGFIYYVSREGVTGERSEMASGMNETLAEIKKHTDLPTVIGFGISTEEHVREVSQIADGAVVGSALVNCIARNKDNREAILSDLKSKMNELVKGLKKV